MYDVLIIGAGAAGLMCALTAGQRGRKVLVVDHANKVGKKILMSGGGRCNFTNLYTTPENFISSNPHFCKSALSRYTQWDFINLVESHSIPYHEKSLGQLFCDNKSRDILNLLLDECAKVGVKIFANTAIKSIKKNDSIFCVETSKSEYSVESVVVATGGLSIPKMGATGFGYEIAEQFGINVLPRRAGLVPFTLSDRELKRQSSLPGTAIDVSVTAGDHTFQEAMLFTHKGLSGPAILQASSYWSSGNSITIDLLPNEAALFNTLVDIRENQPKLELKTWLAQRTTKTFSQYFSQEKIDSKKFADLSNSQIESIANELGQWRITPSGTEGYKTAEVTLGGVNTHEISSKTMMANAVDGLYFIGEVLDVTGHLGGFNFQWAWSSGYAAGLAV